MNYKVDYEKQSELEKFTKSIFRKYKLKGWKIEFVLSKKISRKTRIIAQTLPISEKILINSYSVVLINDVEKLKGCILHEIGHILNHCRPEHDENFKQICKDIGCPYDEPTFSEIEMRNRI